MSRRADLVIPLGPDPVGEAIVHRKRIPAAARKREFVVEDAAMGIPRGRRREAVVGGQIGREIGGPRRMAVKRRWIWRGGVGEVGVVFRRTAVVAAVDRWRRGEGRRRGKVVVIVVGEVGRRREGIVGVEAGAVIVARELHGGDGAGRRG